MGGGEVEEAEGGVGGDDADGFVHEHIGGVGELGGEEDDSGDAEGVDGDGEGDGEGEREEDGDGFGAEEDSDDDDHEDSGGEEAEAIAFGGDIEWAVVGKEQEDNTFGAAVEGEVGGGTDGLEGGAGALAGDGAQGPIEGGEQECEGHERGEAEHDGDEHAAVLGAEQPEEERGGGEGESAEDQERVGEKKRGDDAGVGGGEERLFDGAEAEGEMEAQAALDDEECAGEGEDDKGVAQLAFAGSLFHQPAHDGEEQQGGEHVGDGDPEGIFGGGCAGGVDVGVGG